MMVVQKKYENCNNNFVLQFSLAANRAEADLSTAFSRFAYIKNSQS